MLGFGKGLALSLSAWEEAAIPQEIYSRQVVCGRLSCQHYSRGQAHMIAAASVSLCAPPRPLTRSLDDLRTSASSDGAIRSDGSFAFPIALRSVFGSRGSRRLGARAASIVFQTRARRVFPGSLTPLPGATPLAELSVPYPLRRHQGIPHERRSSIGHAPCAPHFIRPCQVRAALH